MKKPAILLVLTFTILIVFSACGGGGGGGTAGGVSKSSVTVSGQAIGTVGLSSLVGAGKASGVSKSATDGQTIGGAKVIIQSFHNGVVDKTYETVTDKDLGTFSTQLELWSDGGYIVVNIEKDGLVKFSKTYTYNKPEDLKDLNLKAELAPYLAKVVSFANFSTINPFKASSDDTLSIAIVEDIKGIKKLAVNSEVKAAKASGSVVKLQLDLSKSLLKAAADDIGDSLTIKAQNYNPTNEEDMKAFPSDSDTSGNKLVSNGFDFIDIKTASGKSFCITKDGKYGTLDSTGKCVVSSSSAAKQASLVTKSAVVAFKVKRQIDDCSIANQDEDATKVGKQVGFYIYRNGKWLKIGNATLFSSAAFNNLSYGQFDDSQLFSGTCNNNDRPYAVFTETELKQASQDLGFDLSYHNFDYVAMGQLKSFCIEGEFKKIKKNEKSALSGLYLYLNSLKNGNNKISGFRAAYGHTDENGKLKVEGVTTDIDANYDIELSFSDPFTGKWISKFKKLKTKSANGCYQIDLEEVTDPFECSITGQAKKADGSKYPNKYLYTYVKDTWYGYKYGYTDNDGVYTIPVICGKDYVLTDGYSNFDFNVDGTVNSPETDDNGKQVVLNPQFANRKPYVYAYANHYSIKTGETVQLYGYAWDPDGDTLTYSWSGSGTFSSTSSQSPKWTAPSTEGNYTLTLTVSDGSESDTRNITIEVYAGNRPPVISWIYVPRYVVEGDTVNLYGSAYDPDSDTITYNWTSTSGTFSGADTSAPAWTAPSVSSRTTYTINLSVNDIYNPAVTDSRQITVYPDTAPIISAYNIPATVTPGSVNSISAYAYDPEGKPVTYSWTVSGGTPASSTSSFFNWTAPVTEGNVTVNLTVSDGKKSTVLVAKTISVKKTNTAPVISNFNVPATGGINQQITISATANDAENDPLTFSFYVDGNLIDEVTPSTSVAKAATATTHWTPRIRKTYTITVVVSDGALNTKSSKSFTVTNTPPVITNVNIPSTATGGESVTFTATATDADGDGLTYTWYVNNAEVGKGATKSYTFTKKGSYKVKVSVSDGIATVTSTEYTVTVPNQSPVISNVNVPTTGTVGTAVTLSATATDPDGDTLTYTWFAGTNQIGTGASFNWSPTTGGTYSITVRVSDGSLTVTSTAKSITVNTRPSVTNITVTPTAPQTGQTVTLTAVATDADGDTLTYEWYIQNVKQTGTGASISWIPSSAATYTIEVKVSDGKVSTPVSFTKTVTVTGTVTNQPPTTPTITVTPGAGQYTLSATATDPDNKPNPLTYTWYIDGEPYGTGQTIIWPVSVEGTYSVKVVVSDGIATAETSQEVTVKITANIVIN